MQPQHIYRSTTEINETITQGTPLFLDNCPWKNPKGKTNAIYEGFIIVQQFERNITKVA